MRLYLFFKHDRPGDLRTWSRFVRVELGLVARDVRALFSGGAGLWRGRERGIARRVARLGAWFVVESLKIAAARLSIPYLFWRGTSARASLDRCLTQQRPALECETDR